MKDWLVKWLKDHSLSTHTVASAWTILCAYYAVSTDFQNQVAVTYAAIVAHTPAWVKPWVPIGLGLYAWYRNGEKKQIKEGSATAGNQIGSGSGPGNQPQG